MFSIPRYDNFAIAFVPKDLGRWSALIRERRDNRLSPAGDLRALEAAGATPQELAQFAQGYFRARYALFRGLGSGFVAPPSSIGAASRLGFFLVDLLEDPWPVLDLLHISRESVHRWLLGYETPETLDRLWERLQVPEAFRALRTAEGMGWEGPGPFPPLPWFPSPMGPGLDLTNLSGPAPWPAAFQWHGTLRLRHCPDFGHLRLRSGERLVLEHCPGLRTLVLEEAVAEVEILDCPDLAEPPRRYASPTVSRVRTTRVQRSSGVSPGIFKARIWFGSIVKLPVRASKPVKPFADGSAKGGTSSRLALGIPMDAAGRTANLVWMSWVTRAAELPLAPESRHGYPERTVCQVWLF